MEPASTVADLDTAINILLVVGVIGFLVCLVWYYRRFRDEETAHRKHVAEDLGILFDAVDTMIDAAEDIADSVFDDDD